MPQFLLLLHEKPGSFRHYSPEEMQKIVEEYAAWAAKMAAAGRLVSGKKLKDDGGKSIARADRGRVSLTDGPFSETKEVVGGFFMIQADDYAHVAKLCEDNPAVRYGTRIEVREIDPLGEE